MKKIALLLLVLFTLTAQVSPSVGAAPTLLTSQIIVNDPPTKVPGTATGVGANVAQSKTMAFIDMANQVATIISLTGQIPTDIEIIGEGSTSATTYVIMYQLTFEVPK